MYLNTKIKYIGKFTYFLHIHILDVLKLILLFITYFILIHCLNFFPSRLSDDFDYIIIVEFQKQFYFDVTCNDILSSLPLISRHLEKYLFTRRFFI